MKNVLIALLALKLLMCASTMNAQTLLFDNASSKYEYVNIENVTLDTFVIVGIASIDGDSAFNLDLASKRANVLESIIVLEGGVVIGKLATIAPYTGAKFRFATAVRVGKYRPKVVRDDETQTVFDYSEYIFAKEKVYEDKVKRKSDYNNNHQY